MPTDKEISNIINDIVIVVDTREKKNQHILSYLDKIKVPYINQKLNSGDYSFKLPNYKHLNLDYSVLIEKKNSLDEISGNFTRKRVQFQNEFDRNDCKRTHLLIENATWKRVENASWRSQFSANAMWASLLTFCFRYNLKLWFVGVDESPKLLYNIIKYELLEIIKGD